MKFKFKIQGYQTVIVTGTPYFSRNLNGEILWLLMVCCLGCCIGGDMCVVADLRCVSRWARVGYQ